MPPATKAAPAAKKPAPVYRQIRYVPLVYDEIVTIDVQPAAILGIHAQPTGGEDELGRPRQKYVRTVEPQLVYLFTAGMPLERIRVLLLRGQAELPLDPLNSFTYLGATIDKHPRHSGLATAWRVEPL